jgi:hypothetical protein
MSSVRADQRALSHAQLTTLRKISEGRINVAWGVSLSAAYSTLWSLEDRGLIRLPETGKARLTPFGRQFYRALRCQQLTMRAVVGYPVDATPEVKKAILLDGLRECASELSELGFREDYEKELEQLGSDVETGELEP